MGLQVELKGVDVRFREWNRSIQALEGVDLSVEAGEICALAGSNASGKSTLLRLLAGLRSPDGGKVRVGGADPCRSQTRKSIFWMGEKPRFPAQARVRELFAWTAAVRGVEMDASLSDDPFGLRAMWERRVHRLSQGSLQKVALGLAEVLRPEVLLLDEPFTGLDYWSEQVLRERFETWKRAGMTVVLSTHDWALAEAVADCLLVLDHGKSLFHGAAKDCPGIASLFSAERSAVR